MFIDQAEIFVQSGKGGDGSVHFRREKYVPRGGPDGGDGGKGGDIILEVTPHLNTLYKFRYQKRFIAKDGGHGGGKKMTGRSASDLIIPVPAGTVVYDKETDEVLGDLVEDDSRLIVTYGGRGGRGNARFTNSTRQTPRLAERGEPGQERFLRLELKLIADIGIVGVPNAGKSTLLTVVTNAKPKIGAYPFTTIEPNLGVAELDRETTLVLADIPGLIEGAHQGIGLGHDFLRHIQRTHVLIHILDGFAEDPIMDFFQINSELALFDPDLAKKPQIIAFNKMDIDHVRKRWQGIKKELKKRLRQDRSLNIDEPFFAISAATGEAVRPLLYRAAQLLTEIPEPTKVLEQPVYRVESDPNQFKIVRLPNGWRVIGEAIERSAAMTYWEHYQSVNRFQRILEALGVDQALRDVGIQEGDTVFIGDYELEWQD
jgi:GTPase